jgi:transcriptional regulator with XRE-family HTH domain
VSGVDDARIDHFYAVAGSHVRNARRAAGLSQSMLAHRIGFTRSSIANLEAGRQRIALHLFVVIAAALGHEPAEMLPDASLLEDASVMDHLQEHLAGTPATTHEFVRSAVAQVAPNTLREEA